MVDIDPIFISNEPESEEKPTYTVSRLVSGEIIPEGVEIKDAPPPPKDDATYVAYKAPEDKGSSNQGGSASYHSYTSQWPDSIPTKSVSSKYISK
jgi:hypothetical protein